MRVQIVSFHCELKTKLGQLISSSFNQDVATSAGSPMQSQASMLPKFAEALKKLKQGEKQTISLSADQAYGFYDPNLVMDVSRSKLKNGKSLKVGDMVEGMSLHDRVYRMFRVVGGDLSQVTLDANHPLAGQDLIFNVEVTSSKMVFEPDVVESQKQKGLYC